MSGKDVPEISIFTPKSKTRCQRIKIINEGDLGKCKSPSSHNASTSSGVVNFRLWSGGKPRASGAKGA
jgi:hypothetical protein